MTERSVEHETFTIERLYDASAARVFAAWAEAPAKQRWFAEGDGWEVLEFEIEFRVDGREHGRFRYRGGAVHANDTV